MHVKAIHYLLHCLKPLYSVHVVLEIEFSWQYNRYLLIVNEIKKAAHELSEYLFDNCIIWVVNPTLVFIC